MIIRPDENTTTLEKVRYFLEYAYQRILIGSRLSLNAFAYYKLIESCKGNGKEYLHDLKKDEEKAFFYYTLT